MKIYWKTYFDTSGGFWKLWSLKNWKEPNFAYFVSRPLGENMLKDIFWQKWWLLKALKFEKSKLCLFCKPPAWWKTTQRHLLTKVMVFESYGAQKAQKCKLCSFCNPPAWPLLRKVGTFESHEAQKTWKAKLYSFCRQSAWWKCTQKHLLTKWGLLKALKLEKLEKVNSVHFVSCTFGEKNTQTLIFTKLRPFGSPEARKAW